MQKLESLKFVNSYARLAEAFYDRPPPAPFPEPYRIAFNEQAAALIGLDPEEAHRAEFVNAFTGQVPLPGMEPVSMIYAGHQFGVYVPQLGDGRAVLLGEVKTPEGQRWELQLKGSGPTRFSRGADGRAVLRSTIREYLASEAMHGLGIPTTRALTILGSDMPVYRERVESAAILVRMAPSHVRFGSFEYFAHSGYGERLQELADYVIAHHYPALAEHHNPYLGLLETVVERTAGMVARWQAVGFAHGVMNTDNMSILGLTIDYGPYGFLDAYAPGFICNHSDHRGRYAFDQQPRIAWWNLACLAQALLPLLDEDEPAGVELAKGVLDRYNELFAKAWLELMGAKLGFVESQAQDHELVNRLLSLMQDSAVDYTRFFRALGHFHEADWLADLRAAFREPQAFDAWIADYRARLAGEGRDDQTRLAHMLSVNPKYILRSYLAQMAITRAEQDRDFSEVDRLRRLLERPFDEQPEMEAYAGLPPDWADEIVVSCSS
ncbi:MAG: YdiU family protein [Thioalkalivibrio sp.]